MKKFALISFIMAFVLAFCGCLSVPQGANRLLKAPKENTAAKSIVVELSEQISEEYTLKNPHSGTYKSACTLKDVDCDTSDEALLFYSVKNGNETVLNLSVFKQDGDDWHLVGTVSFGGTDVESIDFCELSDNSRLMLCVEWYVYSDIETRISIIDFENLKPVSKLEESCRKYCVYDINEDDTDDVLIFGTNNSDKKSYCDMYSVVDNSVKHISTVTVDGNINKINALRKTFVDSYPALVAEISDNDGTFYTELVVYKKGKLSAPIFEQSGQSSLITRCYKSVKCRDITENGSLEIPCMTVLPKGKTNSDDMYLTEWKNYKNNKFVTVEYSVFSASTDYGMNIDNDWIGNFTCIKYQTDGMIFYSYSKKGIGAEIFRVLPVPEKDFDDEKYKDYFVLETKNGIVYSAKLPDNEKSEIKTTENTLKKLFFCNEEVNAE